LSILGDPVADLALRRYAASSCTGFDAYLANTGRPRQPGRLPDRQIDNLAEHLSLTEINSTEAERDSVKVKLMEYFERETEKKKKTVFTAIITDVRNHGFFIEVAEAGAFGMVPVSSLKDDFYVLNGAGTAFIGRRPSASSSSATRCRWWWTRSTARAPDRFHGAVRQTANPAHSSGRTQDGGPASGGP